MTFDDKKSHFWVKIAFRIAEIYFYTWKKYDLTSIFEQT